MNFLIDPDMVSFSSFWKWVVLPYGSDETPHRPHRQRNFAAGKAQTNPNPRSVRAVQCFVIPVTLPQSLKKGKLSLMSTKNG